MNPYLSFFLGLLAGSGLIGALLGLLLAIASGTPEMALSSIAACMRGFARKLGSLHIIVSVEGRHVSIPFGQIADAVESAELSIHPCEGAGSKHLGTDLDPSPPAARSPQPLVSPRDLH